MYEKPIFEVAYLGKFRSNLVCGILKLAGVSTAKIVCFVKAAQSYGGEKSHFLFSCQYTHGVACWLLGPHDTLPCVLISIIINSKCNTYTYLKYTNIAPPNLLEVSIKENKFYNTV